MLSTFSAIRYRETLQTAVLAKAKAEHSDKKESELVGVAVAFAKPVKFTKKWMDEYFCPHSANVSILSISAGADGIPVLHVKCECSEGEPFTGTMPFTGAPNTAVKQMIKRLE